MMNGFKYKLKKVFSIFLCVIIAVNRSTLSVYATEGGENEIIDDPIIIVSLGDSYSSGEGIEPFYGQDEALEDKVNNPDWIAHRSEYSWPSLLKIEGLDGVLGEHKADGHWYFVAASGAVTDNLLKFQKKEYNNKGIKVTKYLDPQLDVFNNFEKDTVDYVTFTFGGNDVGFSEIIETAATNVRFINPRKLTDSLYKTWEEFYTNGGTKDNIRRAYENISDKAGANANIIVAGYPKLLYKNGSGVLFSKDQAQEINLNVTKFNQAIEKIVDSCHENGMKIYFVSVEDAFDGHEAYTKDAYINQVIMGSKSEDLARRVASAYSVHPNAKGAEAYASCVQAKINEIQTGIVEEPKKENTESDGIHESIREKAEKEIEEAFERFEKMLEERLNQWLTDNCGGC